MYPDNLGCRVDTLTESLEDIASALAPELGLLMPRRDKAHADAVAVHCYVIEALHCNYKGNTFLSKTKI